MAYHAYGTPPSDEDIIYLREFAKEKDLSVRLAKETMTFTIIDLQTRKKVAGPFSYEEAYDFVHKYAW